MTGSATHDTSTRDDPLAYFHDFEPPSDDFRTDAITALSAQRKEISPKYFYDKAGSEIFDAICRSQDYYVTRTEMALLDTILPDLRTLAGPNVSVVEFGSGSSWKIRKLLDSLDSPQEYLAIDISRDHLLEAARDIAKDYPAIRVGAVCADFTGPLDLPEGIAPGRRLGFFPGSTIGNFDPQTAETFLKRAAGVLGPNGVLLIGTDLVKDITVLERAYNDSEGHSARFNLNLLERMRAELGADIPGDAFEHVAFFNRQASRIEMHLRATRDVDIALDGQTFPMRAGETIHTENSYKFTVEGFQDLARKAGFAPRTAWTDPKGYFALHFLDVA